MTRIWRRRAWLVGLTAAVALVATGCVGFTGTKVIEGDAPPGAEFVVQITCTHETEGVVFDGTLTFTEDGETLSTDQSGIPPGSTTCTIVETEDAGATSVEYQCDGDPTITPASPLDAGLTGGGPGASAPAFGNGETTATCDDTGGDGIVVEIFMASTEIEVPEIGPVEVGDSEIEVNFTVINTFVEPPTTTAPPTTAPPEPAPVEAVAPAPVPTQVVTFTG
jgi:hypothetical protein